VLTSSMLPFWGSLIIACFIPFYAHPHELTLMGGINNFGSDKTVTTPPPEIGDQTIAILGNVRLNGDFAENISYTFDLGRDTIWRYYLAGEAVFRYNGFKFGIGTFFQYSEAGQEFLKPSMIVNLGFELPGFFFVDCGTILTFRENLTKQGNFGYNYLAFSVGYWTQNLIAGFFYDFREFEERRTDTLLVRDSLTRSFFHAGIYDKNRMFTVNFDAGLEVLEFEMTETDSATVEMQVLFAGIEFIIQMGGSLSWHLKAEVPYPLEYPSDFLWYTVQTGFTIRLAD
jgi:hypothetical protein